MSQVDPHLESTDRDDAENPNQFTWSQGAIVGCMWLSVTFLFAALAGSLPPEVNEAHYWAKAKHFWDPSWCRNDFFLTSADAHLVFYYCFGWLTQFFSLESSVLIGRWVTWASIAAAWVHLTGRLVPVGLKSFLLVTSSAGFFVFLTRSCDLAGEWVIGGVEAKGMSMAFSLIGISFFLQGNRTTVWIWLGLASAFHVLVGGWIVFCLFLSIAFSRSYHRKIFNFKDLSFNSLGCLLVGGGLALFGLVPGLALNFNCPEEIQQAANRVYCLSRLPHHLLVSALPGMSIVGFSFLLVGLVFVYGFWTEEDQLETNELAKRRPENEREWDSVFLVGRCSLLISFLGVILGLWVWSGGEGQDFAVGLLKYYWFRCSDFVLPISFALGLILLATRRGFFVPVLSVMVLFTAIEYQIYWFPIKRQLPIGKRISPSDATFVKEVSVPKKRYETIENWKKMCSWVEKNTKPDAIFLTPMHQNTFKWYAGRAEVAVWKDVPQDAKGLLEWANRTSELSAVTRGYYGYYFFPMKKLSELLKKYRVQYVVMHQYSYELGHQSKSKFPLKLIYPADPAERSTFVVLKVPTER